MNNDGNERWLFGDKGIVALTIQLPECAERNWEPNATHRESVNMCCSVGIVMRMLMIYVF